MEKKSKVLILSVLGIILLIVSVVGFSYAYFVATVVGGGNTGKDNTTHIETAELISLEYNNGENFNEVGAYPGFKNIHSFKVKPASSAKGKGTYVIHLNSNIDESFQNDIKITLYKTSNPSQNYVTRMEGDVTITSIDGISHFNKVDRIEKTGALEKVFGPEEIITNKDLILEYQDFDESLTETTYFLVYEYVNKEESQDHAQGKKIEGKVTLSLMNPNEKRPRTFLQELKRKVVESGQGVYEVFRDTATINAVLPDEEKANLKLTEYRYAGNNPNNYVKFNDQIWRIIGLVNTPEGQRAKLVSTSIGIYSWDSSSSSVNGGSGVNEWSQADIMKLLNPGYEATSIGGSLYYNKSSGKCYNGKNNLNTSCNFSSTGLSESSKKMIDTITWNTGSNGTTTYYNDSPARAYNFERGKIDGKSCTSCDSIARTTTWRGNVGLIYPSDFGYATIGGASVNRTTCLSSAMFYWDSKRECSSNSWLQNTWTMTAMYTGSSDGNYATYKIEGGRTLYDSAGNSSFTSNVRPTIYLKTNINIDDGSGSSINPYVIS